MTVTKIKGLVTKWAEVIGLSAWHISIEYESRDKLTVPDVVGYCYWEPEYSMATIGIASEQSDDEVEETVVHELLHLHLEGHKLTSKSHRYDPLYERSLNTLAAALVSAKPKRKRRKI